MLLSQPYNPPQRLTDLPNISYETASRLHKVGIRTAEDFLESDPYVLFEAMAQRDPSLDKRALAAIVGAYKGSHWNSVLYESLREYKLRNPDHIWK